MTDADYPASGFHLGECTSCKEVKPVLAGLCRHCLEWRRRQTNGG